MKTLLLCLIFPLSALASNPSVCEQDNRVKYEDSRIGRLRMSKFESACTVTLISKDCAVSAGHCMPFMKSTVEFNVPASEGGVLTLATRENTYEIDQDSVVGKDVDTGNDWAVLKIKANSITKKFPGEVGGFFPVSFQMPQIGDVLRISGYGRDDRRELNSNGALQSDTGPIHNITDEFFGPQNPFTIAFYMIDTTGGASGAALVSTREQDIIGVHTTGGACREEAGNMGTLFATTKQFQRAVRDCLAR
jgi:V8-like Glu-specific endopeptidase